MSQSESTALLTDHYELTMLETALASGVAEHPAVFEVFTRSLPNGRRYGVFAGVPRALEAIRNFQFDPEDVRWLVSKDIVSDATGRWLSNYHFSGTVRGYSEGEVFFPGSPVFTVEAPFGEALLLETVLLSILSDDSAVATTAARIAHAAQGRRLIEMGSRRTNENKAVAAARAAYIGGFSATSNLRAERIYGVPGAGTAAHALTQAHGSEAEAFAAQVKTFGPGTTLLVDTYDTHIGVDTAVAVAGPSLGGIRIDSGDLLAEATWARKHLNELGRAKPRFSFRATLTSTRSIAWFALTKRTPSTDSAWARISSVERSARRRASSTSWSPSPTTRGTPTCSVRLPSVRLARPRWGVASTPTALTRNLRHTLLPNSSSMTTPT